MFSWYALPILPHAMLTTPFVVRLLLPAMREIDCDYDDAGRILGYSAYQRFVRIKLPLLKPQLVVAAALSMAFSLGEFGASWILLRSGAWDTLPVLVDQVMSRPKYFQLVEPIAMATATVLMSDLPIVCYCKDDFVVIKEVVLMSLSIDQLNVRFDEHHVIHSLQLELASKEIIAILGPSGCGKTTLLRTIAGLQKHDTGTIQLNGINIQEQPCELREYWYALSTTSPISFSGYYLETSCLLTNAKKIGIWMKLMPSSTKWDSRERSAKPLRPFLEEKHNASY